MIKLSWLAFFFAGLLLAQQLPVIEVQTLSDKKFSIPSGLPSPPTLLVIGFTKSSQPNTESWGKLLKQTFGADFVFYSIAVLEDVPKLIRGMVAGSIKHDIPKADHDRFLLVYKGQKDLRQAVGFDTATPDDAYLAIVDKAGAITWKIHGKANQAAAAQIKSALGR